MMPSRNSKHWMTIVLIHLIGLLLQQCTAQDSLDGYSFGCGGISRQFQAASPIYMFDGVDKIQCPDGFGSFFECGSYHYNAAAHTLTGTIAGTSFSTTNHFTQDGILISFLSVGFFIPCNVLTLDWRKFFAGNAAFYLKCPAQNPVPADASISYEDNSWAFYESGAVGYTSLLELTKNQNTIRRDSFGVYVWDSASQRMRIYYGPWQSRSGGYVEATFTTAGQLLVDGTAPVNAACFPNGGTINAVVGRS